MHKLFLPCYKTILKTNIIFSIILTLLSSVVVLGGSSHHSSVYLIIRSFITWIMTGGFLLAAFHFNITRKNEYYFYYNLGISKTRLFLITYALHFLLMLPFIYILQYV
ncbi:MAG TPA: hypothetical protein VHO46_06580 [Bacteroidales bacterium]|nr:hypothetical protein [Bacteroidales bacterium]